MNLLSTIVLILYILQLLSIIAVIFIENKDPVSTLSWILVLVFLPIIGFIAYAFLGRGLMHLTDKKLALLGNFQEELQKLPDDVLSSYGEMTIKINNNEFDFLNDPSAQNHSGLIKLNLNLSGAIYSQNNAMIIYTDAKDKYHQLFEDIRAAKHSIHLVYFIISNTNISHQLIDLLTQKASEGVEVVVIYDEIGNFVVPSKMFRKISAAGGKVYKFFPLTFRSILHANYRNHHKIAVIDGLIGYTGGMNIGDEYMGLHPRKTPWRDTHIRVTGNVVSSLQFSFMIDLFYITKDYSLSQKYISNKYFPEPVETGTIGMQIATSGPDNQTESIKRGLIKLIDSAKRTLYIQTPYLMPDQPLMEAMQNAASSGVEVALMLPGIPDKHIPYMVTYSYIRNMLDFGVKVYIYNGFLHAKMLVADDEIVTIGTTNIDMRSLSLHFELNDFIFDSKSAKECGDIFKNDLKNCYQMTEEIYNSRSNVQKLLEKIFRLLAPLM